MVTLAPLHDGQIDGNVYDSIPSVDDVVENMENSHAADVVAARTARTSR